MLSTRSRGTRTASVLVASAAMLAGCASNPRAYSPVMASPPADGAAFEAAFHQCSADVAAGQRANFTEGRTSSAVGGAAIGGVAAVATGASAASGAGMLAGAAGAAGLAVGAVIFAPLAVWGVSRARRAHNERVVRDAMSLCLAEHGYEVQDWELVRGEPVGLATPRQAEAAGD